MFPERNRNQTWRLVRADTKCVLSIYETKIEECMQDLLSHLELIEEFEETRAFVPGANFF